MLREAKKILQPNNLLRILDFGCGHGEFLQVADLALNIKDAMGVDCDLNRIVHANRVNKLDYVKYIHDDGTLLSTLPIQFDVAFSQEVLYTLNDLHSHACTIFKILKNNGFYFATMGCNTDNPFWNKRKKIIKNEEKYPVNDYSLDFVAKVFSNVGFEVCAKKLPLEYFCVYDKKVAKDFGGFNNLLEHVENHKILFCFYKSLKK